VLAFFWLLKRQKKPEKSQHGIRTSRHGFKTAVMAMKECLKFGFKNPFLDRHVTAFGRVQSSCFFRLMFIFWSLFLHMKEKRNEQDKE
jgi:hypothetical protein